MRRGKAASGTGRSDSGGPDPKESPGMPCWSAWTRTTTTPIAKVPRILIERNIKFLDLEKDAAPAARLRMRFYPGFESGKH